MTSAASHVLSANLLPQTAGQSVLAAFSDSRSAFWDSYARQFRMLSRVRLGSKPHVSSVVTTHSISGPGAQPSQQTGCVHRYSIHRPVRYVVTVVQGTSAFRTSIATSTSTPQTVLSYLGSEATYLIGRNHTHDLWPGGPTIAKGFTLNQSAPL